MLMLYIKWGLYFKIYFKYWQWLIYTNLFIYVMNNKRKNNKKIRNILCIWKYLKKDF